MREVWEGTINMVTQFLLIKQQCKIININEIIDVEFIPTETDGDETTEYATLTIYLSNDRALTIEDDSDTQEAEITYLSIIKVLPNIISI